MSQNKYQSNQHCCEKINTFNSIRQMLYGIQNPIDAYKIEVALEEVIDSQFQYAGWSLCIKKII
jgi:hypothetical protein